ncbi:hypothetical protein CCMA1212_003526 [Trichoderma ghanense]|uniref:Uncharacterized protein n=1 Tax=Trichoderma ghanense TaxID=65468 RepID=A0ABY2H6X5_9HYPO
MMRQEDLLDALFCDNQHLQRIADLDVTLHSAVKGILDKRLDLWPRQGAALPLLQFVALSAAGDVLVLEVDLVVQEGHDQAARSTAGSALLPLVASNRVVGVDRTLALLVEAAEHGMCVVWEESLLVENGGQPLGTGVERHGLAVSVAVNLADGVQTIAQSLAIGGKSTDGQDDGGIFLGGSGATDLEDLGRHSGVDAVAAGVTGIARHDGEVGAGNGKRRAAIVGVAATMG